eukprot:362721-Chlamydomonas_euryale.AAC.10
MPPACQCLSPRLKFQDKTLPVLQGCSVHSGHPLVTPHRLPEMKSSDTSRRQSLRLQAKQQQPRRNTIPTNPARRKGRPLVEHPPPAMEAAGNLPQDSCIRPAASMVEKVMHVDDASPMAQNQPDAICMAKKKRKHEAGEDDREAGRPEGKRGKRALTEEEERKQGTEKVEEEEQRKEKPPPPTPEEPPPPTLEGDTALPTDDSPIEACKLKRLPHEVDELELKCVRERTAAEADELTKASITACLYVCEVFENCDLYSNPTMFYEVGRFVAYEAYKRNDAAAVAAAELAPVDSAHVQAMKHAAERAREVLEWYTTTAATLVEQHLGLDLSSLNDPATHPPDEADQRAFLDAITAFLAVYHPDMMPRDDATTSMNVDDMASLDDGTHTSGDGDVSGDGLVVACFKASIGLSSLNKAAEGLVCL